MITSIEAQNLKNWKRSRKPKLKILKFSLKFQYSLVLAQTRENVTLAFLISFSIIKDFHYAINLTSIFNKIIILIKTGENSSKF